jgi:hypothetical protein
VSEDQFGLIGENALLFDIHPIRSVNRQMCWRF